MVPRQAAAVAPVPSRPLVVLVLLAFLFLIRYAAVTRGDTLESPVERSALLGLRSSLGLKSRDWPIKGDPCSNWTGIACRGNRVVELNVSGLKRTRLGRMNPRFSVDGLQNLSSLETFNASRLSLPGSVPEWLGLRVPSLQVLDLRFCGVSGALPGSLGNLNMLKYLYLSDNTITGSISSELGRLKGLLVLDVARNLLTGSIPASFSLLSSLTRLDLSSNFLTGTIPPGLGNISGLQLLNLSDNSLMASIPGELGNLNQLLKLDLGKNSFSGALPVELGGLRSLKEMTIDNSGSQGSLPDGFLSILLNLEVVDLSGNKLDGALPSDLWSMPKLRLLNLSGNNFTGELSGFSSEGNFTLTNFNFSNNMLYGNLTSSLEIFNVIDLSGNYFQGKPPGDSKKNNATLLVKNCLQTLPGQRSLAECRLFYTIRGLVFDDFGAADPAEPSPNPALKSRRKRKLILIGVFGGLGFIIVSVSILVLLLTRCKGGISKQKGSSEIGPAPEGDIRTIHNEPFVLSGIRDTYTYEQLIHATANFSEMNLLKHGHSGDLYHGTLDGGIAVVIKRVDADSFGRESCAMELEILSKISHTRFVPLVGHCFENENERFLVYKYMPNQDLATSFYKSSILEDDSLQSIDWITRMKIAIGVAEGLCYLHHECNPPLVHRDVQAGSILLDDKFEVRLGSLSNVHVQGGDPHHNVITRLLRKPQTSMQGLPGSSLATCAHDVFCFGKVLLELVTGKLGISKSDDSSTKEWLDHTLSYISACDKEPVTKIMDPSLMVDEDLLEEVWAMAIIAKSCLNPKPSKRPAMRHILKALENPLKVIRQDNSGSATLRTTNSSRRSWNFAVFGSWQHSSSENGVASGSQVISNNGFRQSGRTGSQSSGGNDFSSHKRLSNEIFPEPVMIRDIERQDE